MNQTDIKFLNSWTSQSREADNKSYKQVNYAVCPKGKVIQVFLKGRGVWERGVWRGIKFLILHMAPTSWGKPRAKPWRKAQGSRVGMRQRSRAQEVPVPGSVAGRVPECPGSDWKGNVVRLERQPRPRWEGLEATERTLAFLLREMGSWGEVLNRMKCSDLYFSGVCWL